MKNKEKRYIKLDSLEIREADGSGTGEIVGYASVFNAMSEDLGGFREVVRPGAFARTIKVNDIRALWDHESRYVLGRNKAGTLFLSEDERGLKVRIIPPDTAWAGDLKTSIRRGDIDQMSFQFKKQRDEWTHDGGQSVRYLEDVDLFDVSIVTYPAYPQTSAEARDMAKALAGESLEAEPADDADVQRRQALAAARTRKIQLVRVMK